MDYPEESSLRKEAEEIAKVFSRTKEFADVMTLFSMTEILLNR